MAQSEPRANPLSTAPEPAFTGPHVSRDATGELYTYWRCSACGLETTDEDVPQSGCIRCRE